MDKFVSITTAANALGVPASTLRRWDASGTLVPSRTQGGQRHYKLAKLRPGLIHAAPALRRTVAYARVSSHDQKADLKRQVEVVNITVCSARLYGSRSHRNHKLIDGVRQAVQAASCS